MNILPLLKSTGLTLGCAALIVTAIPAKADWPTTPGYLIKAFAGTTFTLTPLEFDSSGNPTKFTHTVDGVVRVSSLGNCTVHADVIAVPTSPTSFSGTGTIRITSADGKSTLDSEGTFVVMTDPANPLFGNFHYDVKFIGGTGQFTNALGRADIDGLAMFTSPSEGKATWILQGYVITASGLAIAPAGTDAMLSWTGDGLVLQSAEEAKGPWTNFSTGIATGTSRYQTNVPTLGPKKFFRLRGE